jgi:hypothetical protein
MSTRSRACRLTSACALVTTLVGSRAAALDNEVVDDLVAEFLAATDEVQLSELAMLLVERCYDGREELRAIALEAAQTAGAGR